MAITELLYYSMIRTLTFISSLMTVFVKMVMRTGVRCKRERGRVMCKFCQTSMTLFRAPNEFATVGCREDKEGRQANFICTWTTVGPVLIA